MHASAPSVRCGGDHRALLLTKNGGSVGGGTKLGPDVQKAKSIDLLAAAREISGISERAGGLPEIIEFCEGRRTVQCTIVGERPVPLAGADVEVVPDNSRLVVLIEGRIVGEVTDPAGTALRGCLALGYGFVGVVDEIDSGGAAMTISIVGEALSEAA